MEAQRIRTATNAGGTVRERAPRTARVLLVDRFSEDRPPGRVIGSDADLGGRRRGNDREHSLAIDNGALRIPWLSDPGWGRSAITYGPFNPQPGRLVAITVLNGLSTSQTPNRPPGGREMVARWWRTFPRIQVRRPDIHESMAVGWFTEAGSTRARHRPAGPSVVASSSVEEEIGKLDIAAHGPKTQRVRDDVQNVPVTYVVLLRHGDAMFYAASMAAVEAFPEWPRMRPLGVLPVSRAGPLFAGVHQAVIGEVEYQLDTRVYDVTVADVPALSRWCSTAIVADSLTGAGPVGGSASERNGSWEPGGGLERTPHGAVAAEWIGSCTHRVPGVIGLIHAVVGLHSRDAQVWLRWRATGGVELRLGMRRGRVELVRADRHGVARLATASWRPEHGTHRVQLAHDGVAVRIAIDGQIVLDPTVRIGIATGATVGLTVSGGASVRDLEIHPLDAAAPEIICPRLPRAATGPRVIIEDHFTGPPGELEGAPVAGPTGPRWERTLGVGVLERNGDGTVRVRASREEPNPGRTIHTVPWPCPELVDLSVMVVPPGTAWGQGHRGRAGVVLWQDADNYLAVNTFLEDTSVGVSISAFAHLLGQETMRQHDAVWTNVNPRIRHGVPFALRVSSDGTSFTCWVDGEAVLHRSFNDYIAAVPRLRIERVGLLVNWEWGDDTGSTFRDFVARGW